MKTIDLKDIVKPQTETLDLQDTSKATVLQTKAGPLARIKSSLAASKAAGEGLTAVKLEAIRAETNIALTGIKLCEASIRTALVGNAMPQIGALTMRVNAATAAVDQGLSNSTAAQVYTHLSNRAANLAMIKELESGGKISLDEVEVLNNLIRNSAAVDTQRSIERESEAKEAVASLHAFAVKGISDAKNKIR